MNIDVSSLSPTPWSTQVTWYDSKDISGSESSTSAASHGVNVDNSPTSGTRGGTEAEAVIYSGDVKISRILRRKPDVNKSGPAPRQHECLHCHKCFLRPSGLAMHYTSHSGLKGVHQIVIHLYFLT